ncbi:hypothetical protein CK203_076181 [Vitis vinifera]|uniref:Uncharacterized protein n=1 Tax=Vitis vinifera TaxID=29760 RepID=A0A438EEL7_VITVI|nr:hypothetical protein CK203_076181 [Vitis vinifera]
MYDLTAANVGLVFGLPTIGQILHIATTPSDHPFAPTSRIDGCRNLWHTIHEDGFRNDVNWGQFVVDQLVEAPLLSAWSDELIKERLSAEIRNLGEVLCSRTPINSYQKGIQQQLGIMRGLIHRLDARRERSVHSPTTGHSGYAVDDFPEPSMIHPCPI